jgi:hypothetical protein
LQEPPRGAFRGAFFSETTDGRSTFWGVTASDVYVPAGSPFPEPQ